MNENRNAVEALVLQRRELAPMKEFSEEEKQIIRDMFGASDATDTEFRIFLAIAKIKRLNPLTKQIYFVPRWDKKKNRYRWEVQTGIHGFRAIAERTGLYAGQDEAEFEVDAESGLPIKATVRVYRKDWTRPAVGTARYDEFVQEVWDDRAKAWKPNHMWAKMPFNQLAKCAEAAAFQKAFSGEEDAGGLVLQDAAQDLVDDDLPTPPAPTVLDGDLVPVPAATEKKETEAPQRQGTAPASDDTERWKRLLDAATSSKEIDAVAREGNGLDTKDPKRAALAKLVGAARKRVGATKKPIMVEGDDGVMRPFKPEPPADAAQGA